MKLFIDPPSYVTLYPLSPANTAIVLLVRLPFRCNGGLMRIIVAAHDGMAKSCSSGWCPFPSHQPARVLCRCHPRARAPAPHLLIYSIFPSAEIPAGQSNFLAFHLP